MINTSDKIQRFVLVGVQTDRSQVEADMSLDELAELLKTAGGEPCGYVVQNLDRPDARTYIGSGKVEEVRAMVKEMQADGIIVDDELSPAQLANLSDILDTKIIDRTLLILDIFSQRAATHEGQMQIELAQLEYRLTRLRGLGTELSRQGAAVGTHTRGAGETKLEMDRRHIRSRISQLKHELREVAENRERERVSRKKNQIPVIALVGYTNAGKSTLLNRLTDAGVLEEDELFATLDTTVRRLTLPDGRLVLLVDTVGFIHKLPSHLVKAFRSTLEEVNAADILLHVVDASSPMADVQMKVTYDELRELGASSKPIITVLNKQDKVQDENNMPVIPYGAEAVVKLSALEEEGQKMLLKTLCDYLNSLDERMEIMIPYTDASVADKLHREAVIEAESFEDEGIYMTVLAGGQIRRNLEKYRIRTQVLPIEIESLDMAERLLKRGQLVAFPTETVYGLGAWADSEEGVKKIFKAKGRPSDNPLIVHIAPDFDLTSMVSEIPECAKKLMEKFWPGPMTLVMKKKEGAVLDKVTAGLPTVAVRMPSDPSARELLEYTGLPIVAPSANSSGRPSPTTAAHVFDDMEDKIPLILDGGECKVGLESTIVDVSEEVPMVLRPGAITLEMLREVIPAIDLDPAIKQGQTVKEDVTPKAPGMKYRHYAPKGYLILTDADAHRVNDWMIEDMEEHPAMHMGLICSDEFLKEMEKEEVVTLGACKVLSLGSREDKEAIAHNLFAALRKADDLGLTRMYGEILDKEGVGEAIMNRFGKASAEIRLMDETEEDEA